jgi:kumamolisin
MATTPRNFRQLEGSELRPSPNARVLGPADETETLRTTIVLRRRPDGPPVPGPAYYLRTPPSERPRLSESGFAARYGADPGDIERVAAFARSRGLTVDEINAARRTVVVEGTVAQFNRAFNVTLRAYEHEVQRSARSERRTEAYRGYDGFIHVPADLVGVVIGYLASTIGASPSAMQRTRREQPRSLSARRRGSMTSRPTWLRARRSRSSPKAATLRAT